MEELRGKPVVDHIAQDVIKRMAVLAKKDIVPTLAVIRVGEREDDLSYERGLTKRFESVEAKVVNRILPEDCSEEELCKVIVECNEDDGIHGILLFRPLPKAIDEKKVINLVDPRKDVDCMSLISKAHTFAQDGEGHDPCTAQAVMEMLDYYKVDLTGKNVVVIGRSMVVGKPLSLMLQKKNATVTMCHTKTVDLPAVCRKADIICAAAGVAKMLTKDYVSEGQIIMDVGINFADGKLCGDVDLEDVKDIVASATPVPGGVGTVTTSVLLLHTLKSAEISAVEGN